MSWSSWSGQCVQPSLAPVAPGLCCMALDLPLWDCSALEPQSDHWVQHGPAVAGSHYGAVLHIVAAQPGLWSASRYTGHPACPAWCLWVTKTHRKHQRLDDTAQWAVSLRHLWNRGRAACFQTLLHCYSSADYKFLPSHQSQLTIAVTNVFPISFTVTFLLLWFWTDVLLSRLKIKLAKCNCFQELFNNGIKITPHSTLQRIWWHSRCPITLVKSHCLKRVWR